MTLRVFLLLVILLASSAQLWAQSDPYVDSLQLVVKSRPNDLAKIDLLDSICAYYKGTYRPGGAPLFQLRNKLIDPESNIEEGLLRLKESSFYLMRTGEIDLGRKEIDFYYEQLDEVKDRSSKSAVLYCKSFLEEQVQNNELALKTIEQAIEEHVTLQDSSSIEYGDSYRARGRILSSMGRFAEANVAYSQAKEMFAATSDSIGMSEVLAQLGILYAQIGLYDDSEDYINERYRYIPNAPDVMRVTDLVNLGRNILLQRRYSDAKANYQKALDKRPFDNGYEHIEIYAYNGLIEASYFNGNFEEVLPLFEEMESVYQKLGAREDLDFLLEQSRFFALLLSEEYEKARVVGEALYTSSLAKQDASEAMLHAEFLTELYKRSGNYANAIKYAEIYTSARDSMLTANKTNALLLYRTQFETKEKELEIDQLAVEKKMEAAKGRTYLWIAGLLGALLLIGGGLYIQLRKTREKLEIQNIELQTLNATKNKFFGIIGHDLGGPLVVFDAIGKRIRRQVKNNDVEQIVKSADLLSESSEKLSSLLDNLLKWALSENGVMPYRPERLVVSKLFEQNTELFTELSKSKDIYLEMNAEEELTLLADKDSVNTICRNLISNAIKFTSTGGKISLHAQEVGDQVELICTDTGVGMDEKKLAELFTPSIRSERGTSGESGTGLGMMLIKELAVLNKGAVRVKSEVGVGTTVRIYLPKA